MDKELLNKDQIEERIAVLKAWIKKGSFVEMINTAVREVQLYQELLDVISDSDTDKIQNTVHTQIYQQIGILI